MKLFSLSALAFAGAMTFLSPTVATAAPQDFTLTNDTGYDIAEVYIGPTSSNDWGDDVMGEDVLSNGADQDIVFPKGRGATCHWDLKVVYTDQTSAQWLNFDLCTISSIKISYDRKTGKTWAHWE